MGLCPARELSLDRLDLSTHVLLDGRQVRFMIASIKINLGDLATEAGEFGRSRLTLRDGGGSLLGGELPGEPDRGRQQQERPDPVGAPRDEGTDGDRRGHRDR